MSLALDRHASNVSPRALTIGTQAVETRPEPAPPPYSHGDAKKHRHRQRRAAGRILGPSWRVHSCGQKALGGLVTLHASGDHAHFGGIETCGSVWTCPVCAVRITEGRRADIDAVLTAHQKAGGFGFMATLTTPHHRFQSCKSLKAAVAAAWRRVKNGKAWKDAKARYGWFGDVKALEVTHGDNGWHPHLHVLVLFAPGTSEAGARNFGSWLYEQWAKAIFNLGMGRCSPNAFTYERVDATSGAADYVSKWGVSLELTKAHTKRGRHGRTPWQILDDHNRHGHPRDAKLFREYAAAFKGARQLTWSRDLRARYLSIEEPSDEQLAVEDGRPETQIGTIDRPLFARIATRGLTAHALIALSAGGVDGLTDALTGFRIPWRLTWAPGLQRGHMVPLISLGETPPGEAPRNSRRQGKPPPWEGSQGATGKFSQQ